MFFLYATFSVTGFFLHPFLSAYVGCKNLRKTDPVEHQFHLVFGVTGVQTQNREPPATTLTTQAPRIVRMYV
jgi:hypothetical protein